MDAYQEYIARRRAAEAEAARRQAATPRPPVSHRSQKDPYGDSVTEILFLHLPTLVIYASFAWLFAFLFAWGWVLVLPLSLPISLILWQQGGPSPYERFLRCLAFEWSLLTLGILRD